MAEYLIQGETLTELGDKIRVLSGTEDTLTPSQMTSNVQSANNEVDAQSALIDQLSAALDGKASGGSATVDNLSNAIIEKTIVEINDSNAISVGDYIFYNCTALTTSDFPVAASIGNYAFQNCTSLTSVEFPNVTSIGSQAFYDCRSLTSVEFPNAENIGEKAFQNCTSLTSVKFPNADNIGEMAFQNCTSLASVEFPNVTSIGSQAFYDCRSLTSVEFPNAENIYTNAFASCYFLTSADFSNATSIGSQAFVSCASLTTLILRSTTMATLSNTDALKYCYHILGTTHSTYNPNGDKDGYIYVPRNLVNSYKANWSTYASQFRAIEDYSVDGTVTGEIDPDKVVDNSGDNSGSEVYTFYIDGTEYQFDDTCNTWYDWCNSKYNTDGYSTESGNMYDAILNSSGDMMVEMITGDMTIEAGKSYALEEY